jgi:hypothetical protein
LRCRTLAPRKVSKCWLFWGFAKALFHDCGELSFILVLFYLYRKALAWGRRYGSWFDELRLLATKTMTFYLDEVGRLMGKQGEGTTDECMGGCRKKVQGDEYE